MAGPMSSRGTRVYLGDAEVAELAFTDITKAAPAVVNMTAAPPAGLVVGSYVGVNGSGFRSVDGKIFKVEAIVANAVTLEDSDTSAEAGVSVGGHLSFTGTGDMVDICFASITRDSPAAATLDTTTLCDNERQQLTGMPNNGTWTAQGFYDPDSAGQITLRDAFDKGDTRLVNIVPPDNSIIAFYTQINQLSESFAVDQPIQLTTGGIVLGKVSYFSPGSWGAAP